MRHLSSASLRSSATLKSAGVQRCVKAVVDEWFKGWCFAPEMRRRNATERSCFCCRCALAAMHFPFYYLPPWLLTDRVCLPREVEYLLDICNVSVANASTPQGPYCKCVLSVSCICFYTVRMLSEMQMLEDALHFFSRYFHLITLMGTIRGMSSIRY